MENIIIPRVWTQGATVAVETLRGTAFTHEALSHTFLISGVTPAGEALPLTGTVLAKFLRADNMTVDISGTIADGVVSVTLVDDCYNVAGRFSLVIYISDGTTTIAIYACIGNVYRATSGRELDSGTEVPSLAQLEAAYNNALTAASTANSAAEAALEAANHGVRYDTAQSLQDSEKERARANINGNVDVGLYLDANGYICQT